MYCEILILILGIATLVAVALLRLQWRREGIVAEGCPAPVAVAHERTDHGPQPRPGTFDRQTLTR